MAVGNTFGATALASYGGFWISFGVILTPGGFQIEATLNAASKTAFLDEFGLYLMVCLAPLALTLISVSASILQYLETTVETRVFQSC